MERFSKQETIENVTFDEISLGQGAQLIRTLTLEDIQAFAAVSGDTNPAHLDAAYADASLFHGIIAHGMWGGALISALLGTVFPGPGSIYLEQNLRFRKPVRVGDTLTVSATVTAKEEARKRVELNCQVVNQRAEVVLDGVAKIIAPTQKLRMTRNFAPRIQLFDPVARLNALLALGKSIPTKRCGVVHPCDADSLKGALSAAEHGLIDPLLIAPEAKLRALAERENIDLQGIDVISVEHSHAASAKAASLAGEKRLDMLMKGSLNTQELTSAVEATPELGTGRAMSHVFRFDVPTYYKPLLLTDAVLNIAPDLQLKADIVQNAINFAQVLGIDAPRVAILSAVETLNPKIPSTLDAAALCKMAERGQITGGILDGPLAFDNAISVESARYKGIDSPVAGQADILVVPDLESGNMLAKQLGYFAGATNSGVILGARVPIALTHSASGVTSRVASALLALLLASGDMFPDAWPG